MTAELDNTPIRDDQYLDKREFRVEGVTLVSSSGAATDISPLIIELQLRQDMMIGYMSGEVMIMDGVDMISQLTVHGSEYLLIHLSDAGASNVIKKAFRVYKISERTRLSNNNQKYILHIVSDEMMLSNTLSISKAYINTKISDIARDILSNSLSIPAENVSIENTSEPVDIIIPFLSPTEALHWLASRAFSSSGHCYYYFENLSGFNFVSLHSMYAAGSINADSPFALDTKSINKTTDTDKYSIDSIRAIRDFDTLTTSSTGGYALDLLGIDTYYRTYDHYKYSIAAMPTLLPYPPVANVIDAKGNALFSKHEAYQLTYPVTTATPTEKANRAEEWIKRVMVQSQLTNTLLELVVPGNMGVQVGKVISLSLSHQITPTQKNMDDEVKSGDYFVLAVNHKFDMPRNMYDTIILVCRDSLPVSLSLDPKLIDKIARLNA